jgi:hypothetical protein
MQIETVTEQQPLEKEFLDSSYWKLDYLDSSSVDDLLAAEL